MLLDSNKSPRHNSPPPPSQSEQLDPKYVLLYYYYGGMVYAFLHDYLQALLFFTVVCYLVKGHQYTILLFSVVCDHTHNGNQRCDGSSLQEICFSFTVEIWQGTKQGVLLYERYLWQCLLFVRKYLFLVIQYILSKEH